MLQVIVCCGIPGSGKSTWAKSRVKEDPENWIRVNGDDFRHSFNGYHYCKSTEAIIAKTRDFIITNSLKSNKNVIVDNCNITSSYYTEIVKLIKPLNLDVLITEKLFPITLEDAIVRDKSRDFSVGESVVVRFWEQGGKILSTKKPRITTLSKSTEDKVMSDPYRFAPGLESIVICDLDGTISLFNKYENSKVVMEYPGAHVRSPYNASNADQDSVNEPLLKVLNSLHFAGNKLFFLSGREDKYETQTKAFLDKHVKYPYQLFMRKSSDSRKDYVVKLELFNAHIRDKYNVTAVFDDRLQVCKLWHQLKLPLFRVGDPEANF